MKFPIYMDYHATTPVDPRVFEAMKLYFTELFGNPASRNHSFGWAAEDAVEKGRKQIASLIGANSKEIVFTSGATESNNLAIKGVAQMYAERGNHIITAATEHKATLDTCKHLEKEGYRVTYLPVQANGLIDLNQLREAITDQTILISIMYANNEIGVVQPIAEIGGGARVERSCGAVQVHDHGLAAAVRHFVEHGAVALLGVFGTQDVEVGGELHHAVFVARGFVDIGDGLIDGELRIHGHRAVAIRAVAGGTNPRCVMPCAVAGSFRMSTKAAWSFCTIGPGVEAGATQDQIRRAYARGLKTRKPEVDPEGFRRLREAYEIAAGGTAPIKRSRIMPPVTATTKDRNNTPNKIGRAHV